MTLLMTCPTLATSPPSSGASHGSPAPLRSGPGPPSSPARHTPGPPPATGPWLVPPPCPPVLSAGESPTLVPATWRSPSQYSCCSGSAPGPEPPRSLAPTSGRTRRGYLECTGQQPPEDLVSAVAEEALGVDAVVVAVEPQLDLVGGILRGTGRLEGDLCGGAPQVHGPQGPAPWPEPPAHPAVLWAAEVGSASGRVPPRPAPPAQRAVATGPTLMKFSSR